MAAMLARVRTRASPGLDQDQWLELGAKQKAQSVIELASNYRIQDVLEIGAGSGAILAELNRREFGGRYWACEPSPELCSLIAEKDISRLVEAVPARFEQSDLIHRRFDLIILSHVLEHLIAPAVVLAAALRASRFVVYEVPLEGTMLQNLRASVRERVTGGGQRSNAGHVQFFSYNTSRSLAWVAGGEPVAERLYFHVEGAAYRLQQTRSMPTRAARRLIFETARRSTRLARLWCVHHAILVKERPRPVDWQHSTYFPP
jgi:SAM-dependent methyltransferase